MQWKVGIIPKPRPKVETISAQERRDAAVADYLRARAAALREVAPQSNYLPLQGGGRAPSEAKAGGWGSIQPVEKTPTIADASHRRSWRKERRPEAADALPLSGGGKARKTQRAARADADVPRSQDESRRALLQNMMPFLNHWRACPACACRRHRRCASAQLECEKLPRRRRSPEQEQAALAYLQRALKRRLAEVKATRPARDDDSVSRR